MRLLIIAIFTILAAQPQTGWAADFSFKKHWELPIPPQGTLPENFSDLEASLDPDDCGSCHETQFEDWQTSRHAKSMGPGITGQFHQPWLDNDSILFCVNCHAPLTEQSPLINSKNGGFIKNPSYKPALRPKGLICAGCHVRKHVRYGPKASGEKVEEPPHNSFVTVDNFGNSEFCKPCHQFDPWNNKVNGKLLQNTYNEWKNSSYPKKGVQCANCHMPERRHLWQGIHTPEMVKKGLKIETERKDSKIFLIIINSGAGHNFPTYVTPKVVIRASVIDKKGKEAPQTVQEKYIGWQIPVNLSKEWYDTRIPPGGNFKAQFNIDSKKGKKFRLIIRVLPDEFYTRFYKTLIENPPGGLDIKKIKKAYKESQESVYTLFEKNWDL